MNHPPLPQLALIEASPIGTPKECQSPSQSPAMSTDRKGGGEGGGDPRSGSNSSTKSDNSSDMNRIINGISGICKDRTSTHESTAPPTNTEVDMEGGVRQPTVVENSLESRLFLAFREPGKDEVLKSSIVRMLSEAGLWVNVDPRLKVFRQRLAEFPERLTFDQLKVCLEHDLNLISRAVCGDFIIPEWTEMKHILQTFYDKSATDTSGANADYIPQLARVNPDQWAVAVCSIDGQRHAIGNSKTDFCVQSTCKPVNYGIALEILGEEEVHHYVGREPSGVGFNELVLNVDGKPHNPLINSGAIMTTSLVKPKLSPADRFDFVTHVWNRLAGGNKVGFSNATYLSERGTADRNYALAHFMREKNGFPPDTDLEDMLQFYFMCCSIEITAENMSIVAGTLANGGVCPVTGEQVFSPETVRDILTMMYACGMYDYSGEFAFSMGIPAKSGVAGALCIVVPNVMGICTWSPRLDIHGNSVRGIQFCKHLTRYYNFHNYDGLLTRGLEEKRDPRKRALAVRNHLLVEICFAASQGDLGKIKRMKLAGVDLTLVDYDLRSCLHLASAEGHVAIVKFLLRDDASKLLNCTDRWGNTPLDDAIRENRTKVVDTVRAYGGLTGEELRSQQEMGLA